MKANNKPTDKKNAPESAPTNDKLTAYRAEGAKKKAELIANLNAARLVKSQPWVYGLPDEAAKWTDAEITASVRIAAQLEAEHKANQYPNLERQIREAEATALNRDIERTTTEEGIKGLGLFYWKAYKGTPEQQRAKWVKFLTRKNAERVAAQVGKLEATTNAPEFSGALIVTLDWAPSRMWHSNPRASTNYGFTGESIGGCGYCKQSTALAQGLNSHLPLMKLLYAAKERGEKLPYGAGYGVLPYFEGGVGCEAHRSIVEALGLEFEALTQAKNSDTFIISRKEASV
jgi:hypothetical protein